jgi:DNA-directed RNA polymerase beta' subunit
VEAMNPGRNTWMSLVFRDELNVHVPQTIEAYAEAEQLLGIYRNLISSRDNKPVMGIVYDTLSGAYLVTYPQHEAESLTEELKKLAASDELNYPPDSEEYSKLESKIQETKSRLDVIQKKIILDPVIFNQAISPVADSKQFATLWERLAKYGIDPRTGRALISSVFPEDFDYSWSDGKGNNVVIKEGILIKGLLTKDTLGAKDGSIIAEMYKQLGGLITVDFMSDIQFVVREFLQQHGLTVGIDDCMPDDTNFRSKIDEILTTATVKVMSLVDKPTTKLIKQQQEDKVGTILDSAKTSAEKITQSYFKPDNALLIMANSGSKGTTFNAVQIASTLGQQRVSGRMIQPILPGNRSLPVFEPNDPDPRSRGFCYNSFASGLEPSEFFFHMGGGREGLTDTAVNTARTGALQHQLIKSAEDIHIASDGSVRTAESGIVQFVYSDGFDAGELGNVKIRGENVPFFRNLQQVANKINRKYGNV